MKRKTLLLLLLLPSAAFAHDDEKLCKGQLFERLPAWVTEHDAWWLCRDAWTGQREDLRQLIGGIRECERQVVKRRGLKWVSRRYSFYVEPFGILEYTFPQHPTEDRFNNVEASHQEVEACQFQLATQVVPEVQRAAAHYEFCKGLK